MAQRLSAKRVLAIVSSVLALYSFARVCVLFFEALAVVREGRAEDYELLALCQRGDARGSAKMREACLKARSDLASPVVFKAIVHAVSSAFKDFSDAVGSPFKLLVVVLFIVSSVMLPVSSWARALFGQADQGYGYPRHPDQPYIAYAPHPWAHQPRRGFRGRVRKMLSLRRGSKQDVGDCEDRFTELEPGIDGEGKHWAEIEIGEDTRPASPRPSHSKWD